MRARPPATALWLVAIGAAVGCARQAPRRTGVCDDLPADASCGSSTPPVAGGPGTPSGADGGAAGGDGGVANVTGQLVVAQTLPLTGDPDASRPGENWRIASEPAASAGAFGLTDVSGRFALEGVPLAAGAYVLRATPPDGTRALGAITTAAPGAASATVVAVASAALEEGAAAAGFATAPGRAHLVLQVIDTPSTVAGVTLEFTDATAANVAYDDARGALSATPPTGARGTIAVFNLAATTAGGSVAVRLRRDGRASEYSFPVMPDHVTWVGVRLP